MLKAYNCIVHNYKQGIALILLTIMAPTALTAMSQYWTYTLSVLDPIAITSKCGILPSSFAYFTSQSTFSAQRSGRSAPTTLATQHLQLHQLCPPWHVWVVNTCVVQASMLILNCASTTSIQDSPLRPALRSPFYFTFHPSFNWCWPWSYIHRHHMYLTTVLYIFVCWSMPLKVSIFI